MTNRDSSHRKIMASGPFKAMANHPIHPTGDPETEGKPSNFTKLTNLNDGLPPANHSRLNLEALSQALRDAGHSLEYPLDVVKNEAQQLPRLSQLAEIADLLPKASTWRMNTVVSEGSEPPGNLHDRSAETILREAFNHGGLSSSSSRDDETGFEDGSRHVHRTSDPLISPDVNDGATGSRSRISLSGIGLESLSELIEASDENRRDNVSADNITSLSTEIGKTVTSISIGRALPDRSQLLASLDRIAIGRDYSGEISDPSPFYRTDSTNDVHHSSAIPSQARGDTFVPGSIDIGVDPSLASLFNAEFSPSSSYHNGASEHQLLGTGSNFNSPYFTNTFQGNDTTGIASSKTSSGDDGRLDLSKTNDLLQQLIEEVRKGRQGFLPINDRNQSF